jgi:hypothetical protein
MLLVFPKTFGILSMLLLFVLLPRCAPDQGLPPS